MQEGTWDSYESTVKKIARAFNRQVDRSELDALGMDPQDYEAALRMTSIELQAEYRNRHGFNVNAERNYVYRGLWNKARDIGRRRSTRVAGMLRHESEPSIPASTELQELERHYEVRDALARLRSRLGSSRFQVLCDVAKSRTPRDAHNPDSGESYRSFTRHLEAIRARARVILSN